jgi:hypothetical protein
MSLRASVVAVAARNTLYGRELVVILERLAAKRIRCVPLRGLALSEELYGDANVRPSGDIDLLVPRSDLSAVADVLEGLGYEELDRRPGFARAYSYTLEFVKDRYGWITVEPHWSLAYPPFADRLDMESVWQRASRTEFQGVPCWRLNVVDLLLHLCLHLVHGGTRTPLLWQVDLDRLLRSRSDLDWDLFLRQAIASNQGAIVARALRTVQGTFDTRIPGSILMALESSIGRDRRSGHRLASFIEHGSSVDGVETFALALSLRDLRRTLHYAWCVLLPSRRFMRIHYGLDSSSSVVCWYARRLGFLLRESLKAVRVLLAQRIFTRPLSP